MSMPVRWARQCPPTWPSWARHWAQTPGSLTRRLVGLGLGFGVEPVVQGLVRLNAAQVRSLPGCASQYSATVMRQRLVRLRVDGQVVVLAQTLLGLRGPVSDWPFLRGLGNRSLGSVLFSDPSVLRGPLYFAKLPVRQAWVQRVLPPELLAEMNRLGPRRVWFARCTRFSRQPDRTPLWVMEVFLPRLEHYL